MYNRFVLILFCLSTASKETKSLLFFFFLFLSFFFFFSFLSHSIVLLGYSRDYLVTNTHLSFSLASKWFSFIYSRHVLVVDRSIDQLGFLFSSFVFLFTWWSKFSTQWNQPINFITLSFKNIDNFLSIQSNRREIFDRRVD